MDLENRKVNVAYILTKGFLGTFDGWPDDSLLIIDAVRGGNTMDLTLTLLDFDGAILGLLFCSGICPTDSYPTPSKS